jgi:glycosyltransferase involved in cell wall biosynthesis
MKRADALVQVSHFEGQPNAVLEAIACNLPVVFSDIPEHRELLDDRGCFFVDPASPESICDGLRACLTKPEMAAERAAVARRALANRSPEEIAGTYRAVYEEILGPVSSNSRALGSSCAG